MYKNICYIFIIIVCVAIAAFICVTITNNKLYQLLIAIILGSFIGWLSCYIEKYF
jgi:hypothetical protein